MQLKSKLKQMENLTGKTAVPFKLNDSQGNLHELQTDGKHWLLLVFHRHLG